MFLNENIYLKKMTSFLKNMKYIIFVKRYLKMNLKNDARI